MNKLPGKKCFPPSTAAVQRWASLAQCDARLNTTSDDVKNKYSLLFSLFDNDIEHKLSFYKHKIKFPFERVIIDIYINFLSL